MNYELQQLVSYVMQQFHQGATEAQVRQYLLQNNWDAGLVDHAIALARNTTPGINDPQSISPHPNNSSPRKNKVRSGVLWILSPFIVLAVAVLINLFFRLAGIDSPIVNMLSILAGMAGVILLFVGPIIGIIKLASRK